MGVLQARILEWVAMPSSRKSSPPKDWTRVSHGNCIAGRFFTAEPQGKPTDDVIEIHKAETVGPRAQVISFWKGQERLDCHIKVFKTTEPHQGMLRLYTLPCKQQAFIKHPRHPSPGLTWVTKPLNPPSEAFLPGWLSKWQFLSRTPQTAPAHVFFSRSKWVNSHCKHNWTYWESHFPGT